MTAARLAAVAGGGAAGSLLRYAVTTASWAASPWTVLVVNVVGCLAAGLLLGTLEHSRRDHTMLRLVLGPGLLGGFTTFSAFAVDVVALVEGSRGWTALTYAAVTTACALTAALLGWWAAGRVAIARVEAAEAV